MRGSLFFVYLLCSSSLFLYIFLLFFLGRVVLSLGLLFPFCPFFFPLVIRKTVSVCSFNDYILFFLVSTLLENCMINSLQALLFTFNEISFKRSVRLFHIAIFSIDENFVCIGVSFNSFQFGLGPLSFLLGLDNLSPSYITKISTHFNTIKHS